LNTTIFHWDIVHSKYSTCDHVLFNSHIMWNQWNTRCGS
jgi:hypothetical protein